jgi:PhnB protein
MAITPYLYYSDVAAAQRFLAKAFGFRKCGLTNKDSRGRIKHSAMKLGEDLVMMGWPGPSYKNPRKLGQATQCLFVNVASIDEHFERAKKSGAQIIQELGDTPFGQRRYGAEDPEGHQWFFGAPHEKRSR